MEKTGTLYIVATPIGNLEDITLRALRVLKEVDLIAAEDTRVTRKLLSHFDIHTNSISYHRHSQARRAEEIVERLQAGEDVALVSDAGMPGISDPGHELIIMAINSGINVVPIPGATAVIAGLVISGLSTTSFAFEGFPPRKDRDRRAFFDKMKPDEKTTVLYESPNRLLPTLKAALSELGDRRVAVARETTKMFEEVFRGTISEAIERFTASKPRGEITLIIEGNIVVEEDASVEGDKTAETVENRLLELMNEGLSDRDAIRQTALEFKMPRNDIYSIAIGLKAKRINKSLS